MTATCWPFSCCCFWRCSFCFCGKSRILRAGCLLVLIAFSSYMILMNVIQAVPAILSSHEVKQELQRGDPDGEASTGTASGQKPSSMKFGDNRPNVYYFLFDEYGGYDNLLHYYDFDNSAFLGQLEDRGFSVSLHSHNTEAVATDTIVPNPAQYGLCGKGGRVRP